MDQEGNNPKAAENTTIPGNDVTMADVSRPTTSKESGKAEDEEKLKRVLVDADNETLELQDRKRGRIELDKDQRDLVLRFVIASHIRIMKFIDKRADERVFSNLHLSQQVTSIFCTVYNCLRQRSINSGELKNNMLDKSHFLRTNGIESENIFRVIKILKS